MKKLIVAALAAVGLGGCIAVPAPGPYYGGDAYYYPAPAVGVGRRFWDAGGILRIGLPGRLSLFGASLSLESERPALAPVYVTDTGIVRTSDSIAITTPHSSTPGMPRSQKIRAPSVP